MYTRKQIDLHERSVQALELINKANNAVEQMRNKLYRYDHAKPFDNVRLFNNRYDIVAAKKKYEAVRERLISWYADIMERLSNEVSYRISKPKAEISY